MRRVSFQGFTLVEMLIVVLVIGIAAGLAVVGLSHDDRRDAEREARRLAGALEHAAQLAQWRSETLGVSGTGDGYRFWRRATDDRWAALADDDVLAPRALPASMTVAAASYAGAPVAADAVVPFRPSGRNEPYTLVLASPTWSLVIVGDPLNRVAIAPFAASR